MSAPVHLDANVILRFVRNDDPAQSPRAAALFRRAQEGHLALVVSAVTLLEVFYVLVRAYKMDRPQAAGLLQTLLSSGAVGCDDHGITLDALRRITSNHDSFGDAYLAATAVRAGEPVASFDDGFDRMGDVQRFPMTKP